jgi:uncharacterized protein (DUF697 family)
VRLPLDIREITSAGKDAREEREQPVNLAVFVEPDAPEELVEAVRARLSPQTSGAKLQIAVTEPGVLLSLAPDVDALIALLGSGAESIRASLAEAREHYVPSVALALGADRDLVSRRLEHPLLDTLVSQDADHLVDEDLSAWLADRLSAKRLSLATNFVFMRKAVAEESVKATAFQNAVIGVVAILPGADMPLMTANQAKMLLQIAAAYGQPLGSERIKELAAVVGGGFVFRTVARELLSFLPGVGWVLKGGVAYAGTLAMGNTAIAYFERGADISEVLREARSARDRAMAQARARMKRGQAAQSANGTGYAPAVGAGSVAESRRSAPPAEGTSADAAADPAGAGDS